MNITYNKHALSAAAQYIWDNNPAVMVWPSVPRDVDDVKEQIKNDMYRVAKENADVIKSGAADDEWKNYSGTGGYVFIFSTDDNDTVINVDIYVQPAFRYKFVEKKLPK